MLSTDYSGPFEEPTAGSEGPEMTATVEQPDVDTTPGDEFSITSLGGRDGAGAGATGGGQVLDAEVDVADMTSPIDAFLADTALTREDLELLLQGLYVGVTIIALYYAAEGQR